MVKSSNLLKIASSNVGISITSDNLEILEEIKNSHFLPKYIPGLNMQSQNEITPEVNIEITTTESFINFDLYPRVRINPHRLSIVEIITIIELVLERARQERGIYCIHSSCVIYNNEAIIFWGDVTGMGKTCLAESISKLSNGEFYSDEKTLIDLENCSVIGGIGFVNHSKHKMDGDGYEKYGLSRADFKPIKSMIYGVTDERNKLWKSEWSPEKFEWHLYEELSRKIRATSRRVFEGNKSVPSIDTPKIADQRIKNIIEFTKKIKCYQLAGSVDQVASFLTS